jgi:hypothetical protein
MDRTRDLLARFFYLVSSGKTDVALTFAVAALGTSAGARTKCFCVYRLTIGLKIQFIVATLLCVHSKTELYSFFRFVLWFIMKRFSKRLGKLTSFSPPPQETNVSVPEALAEDVSEDRDVSEEDSVNSDGVLTWDRQRVQTHFNQILVAGRAYSDRGASPSRIRGSSTPLSGPSGIATT